MCVVYVDSYLVGEIFKRAVDIHVAHYYVAYRSGAHEILLTQAESLTFEVVIVRVEDLCERMCDVARAESVKIVAGVECTHIEGHTLRLPETEL